MVRINNEKSTINAVNSVPVGHTNEMPPTKEQVRAAQFYGIEINSLSSSAASQAIEEFEETHKFAEYEWLIFGAILDMVDTTDFWTDENVSKPFREDIESALMELMTKGYTTEIIEENLHVLVDVFRGRRSDCQEIGEVEADPSGSSHER